MAKELTLVRPGTGRMTSLGFTGGGAYTSTVKQEATNAKYFISHLSQDMAVIS